MQARIYRPAKTVMQSGRAKARSWVLEFDQLTPRRPEPLMGWTSSGDTLNQVRLRFASREDAVAYAERKGLAYTVEPVHSAVCGHATMPTTSSLGRRDKTQRQQVRSRDQRP